MSNGAMLFITNTRRRFGLWRAQFRRPIITQPMGNLPLGTAPYTYVSVVSPLFKQNAPLALTLSRIGFCRGFEQIGVPYVILGTHELAERLPEIANPICALHNTDYLYLDRKNLAALGRTRHFVWLDYWFKNDVAIFQRAGMDYQSFAEKTYRPILQAEPEFTYTISPTSSFSCYERWTELGLRLESLPLACDPVVYHPQTPDFPQFADVKMAFVGGYWPFKAMQFERYLRPYEQELTIFGRARWPYAGYGGRISQEQEAALYRQARLSPTVNEPHCEMFNIDQNERVFKVLGSGGCSITDAIPGYREWFNAEELPVPDSLAHYHEMVRLLLSDDDLNHAYRTRGYQAIMARHTYAHRAKTILEWLKLPLPVKA